MKIKSHVPLIFKCILLCAIIISVFIVIYNFQKYNKPKKVNTTGFPIVTDNITLKMFGMYEPGTTYWEDNLFFKRMEELTNISLTFEAVPIQSYYTKKSFMLESTELPDFLFRAALSPSEEVKYSENGTLIPLNSLIDNYAPNLKSLLDKYPEIKKSITLPNGNIVALPDILINGNDDSSNIGTLMFINKKWLSDLNLSEPTNLDEFYNVLKQFKYNDPNGNGIMDEVPLSFVDASHIKRFMGFWGLLFNDDNLFVKDDKVIFAPSQPQFKDALIYLNKLYNEGLLDIESITQTYEQQKSKGLQNSLGCFLSSAPFLVVGESLHFDYTTLVPFQCSDLEPVWQADHAVIRGTFAITKNNEYPEATMRWVDYLYTEEGAKLALAGEENSEYITNPDGTWDWILEPGESQTDVRSRATVQGATYYPELFPYEFWQKLNNKYESSLTDLRNKVKSYSTIPYPLVYLSIEEQNMIDNIKLDINSYVDNFIAMSIIGNLDINNEWDSYLQTLNNMGLEQLIDVYQNKYNEYKE